MTYFVLNDEREKLYQRIEQQIDEMLENGLIEEVKALKRRGCTKIWFLCRDWDIKRFCRI